MTNQQGLWGVVLIAALQQIILDAAVPFSTYACCFGSTIWRLSSQDGRRMDVQASDHPFGGRVTRSETHKRHALRPPVRRLLRRVHRRFLRRVTREKGLTRPDDASPKNARRVGPKWSRTVWCVRLRGSRPKGWEASVFRQHDASQRPIHKKDMTRDISCAVHTRTPAQSHVVTRQSLSAQHGTCKHRERRESRQSTCAAVSVKTRPPPPRPTSLVC